MSAIIIDGNLVAAEILEKTKTKTARLKALGITPCLAVVLVGDNAASITYVSAKKKTLEKVGMENRDFRLQENTSEKALLTLIDQLNSDEKVHGILVQLPLPKHIDEKKILFAIDPKKDVDGFHPISVGNLVLCRPGFLPCTPNGILALLESYSITTSGAHAVVVGRSNIVGKPLSILLARWEINATVTICHTGTHDLAHHTRQADILISAAGIPNLIKADMVKKGAAVIDVGVNRIGDATAESGYRICGDVDFPAVEKIAGYITPVPGGVGPMTIAMLLQNVADAAERVA